MKCDIATSQGCSAPSRGCVAALALLPKLAGVHVTVAADAAVFAYSFILRHVRGAFGRGNRMLGRRDIFHGVALAALNTFVRAVDEP